MSHAVVAPCCASYHRPFSGTTRGPSRLSVCSLIPSDGPRRVASTGDLAQLLAGAAAMPKDAEELFQPLAHSKSLPVWAEGYLSLLAESTNSHGSMQNHLMQLLVRGAAGANKIAHFAQNPIDGVIDSVADTSSDMLLRHMAKAQASTPGANGWRKLRSAVEKANYFKPGCGQASDQNTAAEPTSTLSMQEKRSKDDTCLPPPSINPVHSQVLSIMLSMLMTGVVNGPASAVADALPKAPASIFHAAAPPELTHMFECLESKTTTGFAQSAVAHAPSVTASIRAYPLMDAASIVSHSSEAAATAEGMAASAALRLLRADSKRMGSLSPPEFNKVLDAVLDTFDKSVQESQRQAQHASLASPRQRQ